MSDKCPKCGSETECLAGHSAHPNNWYCSDEAGCGWQAWDREKTKQENSLKQQNEALLAQVEESNLQYGLLKIACEHKEALLESCEKALADRDSSLDSLKARIEGETIDRCINLFKEGSHPELLTKAMPRKYQPTDTE